MIAGARSCWIRVFRRVGLEGGFARADGSVLNRTPNRYETAKCELKKAHAAQGAGVCSGNDTTDSTGTGNPEESERMRSEWLVSASKEFKAANDKEVACPTRVEMKELCVSVDLSSGSRI
jgi:hypothetical protein